MIRFEAVSVTYADAAAPAISGVDLEVPEGQLCLVVGRTGSGKSTLLRCVNGLVPHFSGGRLSGRVTVAGRDTRLFPPRELADVVGLVVQDPLAGFVSDTVEEELAYSAESLGIAPEVIRRRVEDTLDFLGLADLRSRSLSTLSGGQQQRVAIGAALTAEPRVLVLDEPTSALDPGAAEEVLGALHRLVHDVGVTVVIGEHRLERVVQYADRVVWLPGDGAPPVTGLPGEVLARSTIAPPVVRLGQLAGWPTTSVSVRDARAQAGPLRQRLGPAPRPSAPVHTRSVERLRARGVIVRHPGCLAVNGVDLTVSSGERVALMGRNGSGKSSLLWALQGSGGRYGGVVQVAGDDPARLPPDERRRRIGLVPQQPGDLLYLDTVAGECAQADRESVAAAGSALAAFEAMAPGVPIGAHPRDLSEGQRLALVLAISLVAKPYVMLLDEPTRGLDYPSKAVLSSTLAELAAGGQAVILATHDVEFVAEFATRVVIMADGEIVADGEATDVITSSAMFAPQVAKVLAPQRWTTVDQVRQALASEQTQ